MALHLVVRQRLVIGKERIGTGDVGFRLPVHAAMDRVVRPLEQQSLAIAHQLDAGIVVLGIQIVQSGRGRTTDAVMSSSTWIFSAG